MNNIVENIENNNFDFILSMETYELNCFFNGVVSKLPNKTDVLRKIIPYVINKVDGRILFDCIYNINEFNDYTIYLLHSKRIKLENISFHHIKYLVENTSWGLSFLFKNIDNFMNNNVFINYFVQYFSNNKDLYRKIFYSFSDNTNRIKFVCSSLDSNIHLLTDDEIISSVYEKVDNYYYEQLVFDGFDKENSKVILNRLGISLSNYKKYDNLVLDNYDILFNSLSENKITFLKHYKDYLSNDFTNKYNNYLKLYDCCKPVEKDQIDNVLTNIINYDLSNLNDEISSKLNTTEIKRINGGSTSTVFKIGNSVLKLGSIRYNTQNIRKFFRFIPSDIRFVKDYNSRVCAVVEWQKYIDTKKKITPKMIYKLLCDLRDNNLVLCDPLCLNFNRDNFGFLNDYTEASLDEKHPTYDSLPNNFKNNPLVLLDLDLIYEEGNVPSDVYNVITMEDTIKTYEDAQEYKKMLRKRG